MEAAWFGQHWFELFQTFVTGGLLFTTYTIHRDEQARKIANLIAIRQQHREIWQQLYTRPSLFRVLKKEVDLMREPPTGEEWVFVKDLILHLDTVHRTMKAKMFVRLEGVQQDIKEFLPLPIPKAVWEKLKPFQDSDFVRFIERSLWTEKD